MSTPLQKDKGKLADKHNDNQGNGESSTAMKVTSKGSPARNQMRASRNGLSQTVAAAASLLEEGDRAHAGMSDNARDLLLDEIEPDPDQPRRHFDEAELRSLAEDIARRGVLQPILVRPPSIPGAAFRLVAGERRWRASRLAGKVRIPARIQEMVEEEVQAAQLAENILRAGLSDIEKGRALRRLYELRKAQNHKATWEDIAFEVGLGRARINDLFHLASLPEPIAALVSSGRLTGSHGIILQRAQEHLSEEDLIALAEQAARPAEKRMGSCNLSVARLRQLVQVSISEPLITGSITELPPNEGLIPEDAQEAEGSQDAKKYAPLLPLYLRQTLEALSSGTLSLDEKTLLQTALAMPDYSVATRKHSPNLPRDNGET